jgi:hypothetical protein
MQALVIGGCNPLKRLVVSVWHSLRDAEHCQAGKSFLFVADNTRSGTKTLAASIERLHA